MQLVIRIVLSGLVIFCMCLSVRAGHDRLADSLGAEFAALPDTGKISFLIQASWGRMYAHPAQALQYVNYGLEIAESRDGAARIPDLMLQRGTVRWALGDFDAARRDYEEARRAYQQRSDSLGIAKVDNNLGLVYTAQSYYALALEAQMRSLAYFEPRNDIRRLPTLYNNIANVHHRMEDLPNAEAFYRKALRRFELLKDTNGISMVSNNLGLVVKEQGKSQEADQLFATAEMGYIALGNPTGLANVLSNLGSLRINQERWVEADSLYHQALRLSEQVGNQYDIAVAHLKLAEFYLKTRAFGAALPHAEQALAVGEGPGALIQLSTTHQALSLIYEGMGDYAQALRHFKEHKALNDSIFGEQQARAIAELSLKYDSEIKDQKLAAYAQEERLAALRTAVLVGAIVFLLVVGLLIYLRQRAVLRREKLLGEKDREVHETQQALTAAELRAAEAEKLLLRDEVDFKSREITSLAMHIVRKNELLETLDHELKQVRKSAREGGDEKIRDLSLLLAQTLSSEKERKEIELFIDQAQQNFFLALDRAYPDLSQKEKRLCGMILQGLSSKEIAAVFNINTASVEVSRYRIRKKLGLDGTQELHEFLRTLAS